MLRSAGAMGVLVVLLLAAAPAARAGDGFPDPGFEFEELRDPDNLRAIGILEAAQEAVQERWPACRRQAEPLDSSLVDPPMPVEALTAIGVLRRPQTPAEAGIGLDRETRTDVRGSLRVVRTLGGGDRVTLSIGSIEPRLRVPLLSAVCRAREARAVRMLAHGRSREVRRAVRRFERLQAAEDRRRAVPPATGPHVRLARVPAEHVDIVGIESLVVPLERLVARGVVMAVRRRGHSLILLAVPDGVARAEVTLARGRSPISELFYPTTQRASGAVVDNLAAIHVGRPAVDDVVVRQRWLAPGGTVIRDIDCPRLGC